MKKCVSCGKEIKESAKFCMHCGETLTSSLDNADKEIPEAEISLPNTDDKETCATTESAEKPKNRKKLAVIALVVAVLLIAGAGVFIAVNNDNNKTPVLQNEENKGVSSDEADKPASQNESNTDDSAGSPDEATSSEEADTESSSSGQDSSTLLPEDFSMEDIEALIDEFNNTTDEERKEQLRLILEEIFSRAEELTIS